MGLFCYFRDLNKNIVTKDNNPTTLRLFVILGGTAAILYGISQVLKQFYPIFDDLHDSEESEE